MGEIDNKKKIFCFTVWLLRKGAPNRCCNAKRNLLNFQWMKVDISFKQCISIVCIYINCNIISKTFYLYDFTTDGMKGSIKSQINREPYSNHLMQAKFLFRMLLICFLLFDVRIVKTPVLIYENIF